MQGAVYSDFPGGRQDLIFIGTGNLSWLAAKDITMSAGVKFTQQSPRSPTSTGTASTCSPACCST
jgi:hypothetical protein